MSELVQPIEQGGDLKGGAGGLLPVAGGGGPHPAGGFLNGTLDGGAPTCMAPASFGGGAQVNTPM